MKRLKGDRVSYRERLKRLFMESDDSFGVGCPWGIELRGGRRLNVCGCIKILCYSRERIGLLLPGREVWIDGQNLFCVAYLPASVTIEGEMDGIRFARPCKIHRASDKTGGVL